MIERIRALSFAAAGVVLLLLCGGESLAGDYYPPRHGTWEKANLDTISGNSVKIDYAALDRLLDFTFARGRYHEEPHKTNALIILTDGRILHEEYGADFNVQDKQYIWSISKLLANAILGRAEKLQILDRNTLVPDVLPDFDDPKQKALTLEHLMRMSSGINYYEEHPDGIILSNSIYMNYAWRGVSDVAGYMSMQGAKYQSGRQFNYSSGDCNLAMATLRAAFDSSWRDGEYEDAQRAYNAFPWEEVFLKIGMSNTTLEQDGTGVFMAGSFGWSTARDLARLALLYLRRGAWDINADGHIDEDEWLFERDWVEFSSTVAPSLRDKDFTVEEDFLRLNIESYGAFWWLNRPFEEGAALRPYANLPEDALIAMGFRGQTIAVLPSLDAIVVRLGSDEVDGKIDRHLLFGLLMETLIPGFEPRESINPTTTGYDFSEVNSLSLSRLSDFFRESSDGEIVFDDPFSIAPAKDLCSCLFVMEKSESFCLDDGEQYRLLRGLGLVSKPVINYREKSVKATSRLIPLFDHLPLLNLLWPSSHTATARHVDEHLGCMISRLTAPWRGPVGPLDIFGDFELRPAVDYFD